MDDQRVTLFVGAVELTEHLVVELGVWRGLADKPEPLSTFIDVGLAAELLVVERQRLHCGEVAVENDGMVVHD